MAAAGTSKSTRPALRLAWVGAAPIASLSLPLEPVAASRPRVTRWGTYHAKPYRAWLDAVSTFLRDRRDAIDPAADLVVVVESILTKARTSKLRRPRPDVDNLAKGPLDALTHADGWWKDDSQVVALVTSKRFAAPGEPARTDIHIYALP